MFIPMLSRLIILPDGSVYRHRSHWLWNSRSGMEDEWLLSEWITPPRDPQHSKMKLWNKSCSKQDYSWTGRTRLGSPSIEHSFGACLHFHHAVMTEDRRQIHGCTMADHARIAEDHQKRYGIKDILST